MSDLVEHLRDRMVCSLAHNSCRNDLICEQAADRIEELEARLATARNDALEEAAIAAEVWYRNLGKGTPHDEIRALKSTNQTGKENE